MTGYIQMKLMTCCFGRKRQNVSIFLENIQFLYIYVLVDKDTTNNSGR